MEGTQLFRGTFGCGALCGLLASVVGLNGNAQAALFIFGLVYGGLLLKDETPPAAKEKT